MKRFWFEFEFKKLSDYPLGIGYGCGVTAFNRNDTIKILKEKLFKEMDMSKIKDCIENININDLDQGHVIPNMKSPNERGIWLPQGY